MEIVKAFNENGLHTEIVIKGTTIDPIFRASDIGEILEMSNIRATIQNFDTTEKVVNNIDTLGGTQQVTFLTEKGLYKVLFKSRKPIAEKFQNWVCGVIKEIRLTGKYNLEKQLEHAMNEIMQLEDKKKQEYDAKLEKQKILGREKILLKEYATSGAIFYVIRVKTFENGHYIVKIGESRRGIADRYKEHKLKYGECLLLDCFAVNKSKDFETFIKDHELVRGNKVSDLPGHEKELELFHIGKNLSYNILLDIINNNLKYFNNNDTSNLELEIERLKIMLEMKNNNNDNLLLQELRQNIKQLSQKIDNLENLNKEVISKLNSMQTKTTTNFNQPLVTVGPRLQKINPETMTIVKVYESVAECLKESNFKIKRPSIDKAVKENTIYNGFRWDYVNRNEDPSILHNISPTKHTKNQNLGYIAKVNKEKTEIINVYIDRKTAAFMNGYSSSSALDIPVKNLSVSNGYYYILYNKCPEKLIIDFEDAHGGEPILYKDGVGQYNSENILIKEFVCKYDCIKQLAISDKTMAKVLDNNILYNNFYFKRMGGKLKML
jgi:prophage antirepressor-like protein